MDVFRKTISKRVCQQMDPFLKLQEIYGFALSDFINCKHRLMLVNHTAIVFLHRDVCSLDCTDWWRIIKTHRCHKLTYRIFALSCTERRAVWLATKQRAIQCKIMQRCEPLSDCSSDFNPKLDCSLLFVCMPFFQSLVM